MASITDQLSEGYRAAKKAVSSAPPSDAYLRWDAPGIEEIKSTEEQTTREIADIMKKMQKHNFDQHRHAFRATHVKTQGIVKGKLTVNYDLPIHLRQGIFAEAGRVYDVAARFANEPVFLQPDQSPGPRGLSLKVFGVNGELLEGPSEANTAQDFFFNNAPMIELTDIDTCLDIMKLREKHFDDPVTLKAKTALRTDALKQTAPGMLPNTNIISMNFYTQSAFRFGGYYGHMGLFPADDKMSKKASEKVQSAQSREVLSEWLKEYFTERGAKYEFKIQLGTDPAHHPTEDASVVWDEATAPYQTLGFLEFPPQDPLSPARRVFWEDQMSLSPWRGLSAHKPLGSINRLRKVVYQQSQKNRDELNANSSRDVNSVDAIP
ncbi:heme-dependent catalase [Mytilinidion resinicola]|uniref:Heme-dependent catalase n=1 Tax=Mytilinidion resinicola TaxID=574789 RepID=A0A6A6Z4U0_9PEZI|nr:heme-dependent catalase [Mytilinidion resinicola]KAF2816152.1 heme-dependent catalase [Mytilinidion resinicola]